MSDRLEAASAPVKDGLIGRRTITKAAMWSVPVVAAAVAVPLAAASTAPQVDLWSTARLPSTARDGVYNGESYWQGPRLLAFNFTFGNLGPDDLPAGAMVSIGLPFASIWQTDSFAITSSGGYSLAAAGSRTETFATDPILAVRRVWDFALGTPLASGARFAVNFTVQMNGTNNTATNYWRARPTSNIQAGPDVTDTDPGNNTDYADNYAFFNNKNAD